MKKRDVYLSELLVRLGACEESILWARSCREMPGGLRAMYEATPRGRLWLHWLLANAIEHRVSGARLLWDHWWIFSLDHGHTDDVFRAAVSWENFAPVLQRLADKVMAGKGRR